mgnify:CR=1 FL=1
MTISSLSAARLACEIRNWELTNLELQKILYIAHVAHLGSLDRPLIEEPFEAWDFGPVIANLYHYIKGFGSNKIGANLSPNVTKFSPSINGNPLKSDFSNNWLKNGDSIQGISNESFDGLKLFIVHKFLGTF